MLSKKKTETVTADELLEIAKQQTGQLAKQVFENTELDRLQLNSHIRLADFAERRFQ